MRFVFSVVRFVPDPARGEFVNVAAIVGSEESSEWQTRQVGNMVRARAIDDRNALGAVWSFLNRIDREMDEYERSQETLFESDVKLSEAWLQQQFVEHRNLVQLSAPAPMIAGSADEALERIFDLLVVDPAMRTHSFRKKNVALAAVRAAYRQHYVEAGVNLRERVALETSHHRERVDFAVTNGQALQLTQTWSFEVPDQEQVAERVKAWGWTVQDVRKEGGVVSAEQRQFSVDRNVDIAVVYVPPAPGQAAPAMLDALNVFNQLDIQHGPLETADPMGERARKLLIEAGVTLNIAPRI